MTESRFLTPRQRAREAAFQFLFRAQEGGIDPTERDFLSHLEHFHVLELSRDFAKRIVKQTIDQLAPIDEMIKKHAANWRLDRIGAVEKSLLRMGVAELLFFKDVPSSVTLDEIVELGKVFGTAETHTFLNGILDPISREELALQGKIESESKS